jgi:hypothetical protein
MNALKHGLTARTVVLSNENGDEYTDLLDSYVDHLQPNGPIETDLVLEMVNARWQQRRLSNIESELFDQYMEKPRKAPDPAYDSHHATVEHTAAFRIMSESTALTMLNRMKSRLERTYSRALNNLLRRRRVCSDKDKKDDKRTQSQNKTPVTIHKSPLPEGEHESNTPPPLPPVPSISPESSDPAGVTQ